MPEKIGFVGVGRMGANMARRLKEVGYPITAVYDVRKDVARQVAAEVAAEACDKLSRVTALSDVIITVVTDDDAMRNIFSGKNRTCANYPSTKKIIDLSGRVMSLLGVDRRLHK